ncbi:hypothetical protein E3983_02600 [Legionella israelensis]|uniref:Helicase XPB/Ssl2 N-terminal domain-containing protein n=1 Tax=Legionella israelensis TaxID=454 RepID=A0AAX1EDZ7_9GAMM|nr:hypothetical protein [Legionella israelensis]QBR83350.1 hypothetical protein E3983_02600 [Legionella israelensis]
MPNNNNVFTEDFLDFIGDEKHLLEALEHVDVSEVEQLAQLSSIDLNDHYAQLCQRENIELLALKAFQSGKITRLQITTFLEGLYLHRHFSNTSVIALLDKKQCIHPLLASQLRNMIASMLLPRLLTNEDIEDIMGRFQQFVLQLPVSEQLVFQFTDDRKEYRPLQEFFIGSGVLAETYRDMDHNKSVLFHLSMGLRDALMKALYGENAKALFPRLGRFSIDLIDAGMHRGGRYSCVPFSKTAETESFHGQNAGVFYALLHDEVHRRLISAIPNHLYQAVFHSIDLIREKTGVKWSHFIWNMVDLEFQFNDQNANGKMEDTASSTRAFCEILSGKLLTQDELFGLFTASPKNISIWILLLDMFEHPDAWKRYGVVAEHLTIPYLSLFQQIEAQQKQLAGKTLAEKVLYLYASCLENESYETSCSLRFTVKGTKGRKAIVMTTDSPEEDKKFKELSESDCQLSWSEKVYLSNPLVSIDKYLVRGYWDLEKLLDIYPLHFREIAQRIIDDGLIKVFDGDSFVEMVERFPSSIQKELINALFANPYYLSDIFSDVLSLKTLCTLEGVKESILPEILKSTELLESVTVGFHPEQIDMLIKFFPEHGREISAKIKEIAESETKVNLFFGQKSAFNFFVNKIINFEKSDPNNLKENQNHIEKFNKNFF